MVTRMQRTLRGRNALLNVFEMWVALAGIVTGLVFLSEPNSIRQNAITETIGYTLAAAWSLAYMVTGLIIWYGLLRPSPRWEVVGLFLLGSATSANGIAILSIFGLRGAGTAVTLLALTVAAWLRASFVMRSALRLAEESDVPLRS